MPDTAPNPTGAPTQSKRFIAFMTSELSWTLVICGLLVIFRDCVSSYFLWLCLILLALGKGAIEGLYLGGQASLDSYVRLAQIAAEAGVRVDHKGMTLHESPPDPPNTPEASE